MMLSRRYLFPLAVTLLMSLTACAPTPEAQRNAKRPVEIQDEYFVTADGLSLPLKVWSVEEVEPEAVVIALHGFNDYSNAFAEVAEYWAAEHGIFTFAYDQRGFGDSPEPGTWAGVESYVQDVRDFSRALRRRFPETPIHVIGESMGGAIAMVAFGNGAVPEVDGLILSAPAVWARKTMPWYQRAALFIGSRTIPKASFTGKGLGVVASDNTQMLINLGRDPKVIKETKVASIHGLANLMDAALQSAENLTMPSLILIGKQDQIVPNHASATMLSRLPDSLHPYSRTAVYENGYHMLLRDLQRQVVWDDIVSWIKSPNDPLPSGADSLTPREWVALH